MRIVEPVSNYIFSRNAIRAHLYPVCMGKFIPPCPGEENEEKGALPVIQRTHRDGKRVIEWP